MAVNSTYNTRRHAPKRSSPASDSLAAKRLKLQPTKRDLYTPPASPERAETLLQDGEEDATFLGIVDYLRRHAHEGACCSRQIAEGMLAENKVVLNGSTPSTTIDAAIRGHFKRSTAAGRPPAMAKAADPQFPRKTLYHLADASPLPSPKQVAFSQQPQALPQPASGVARPTHKRAGSRASAAAAATHSTATPTRRPNTAASSTSQVTALEQSDTSDLSEPDVNDGLGPFAGPLRQAGDMHGGLGHHSSSSPPASPRALSAASARHLRSPSPELAFSLSIDEAKETVQTPAASQPPSPLLRERMLLADKQRSTATAVATRGGVNIALPPSPFISPQQSDEEAEAGEVHGVPSLSQDVLSTSTGGGLGPLRYLQMAEAGEGSVRSPEEVTLSELDDLLSAYE